MKSKHINSIIKESIYSESGRSLTEMLGVLAIMGILTIGGIAGFNYAMNKHRANTLLNEASKRAVVVTGQINMLGYTPSLQEFTNNQWGYGAFENTVYGADGTAGWTKADKQFTLSVTGVSEGVCAQMQRAVAKPIQSFQPETCAAENNTVKLTYNNDMSAEEQVPAGPSCPAGTSETGAGGYASTLSDGTMCYCATSGTTYQDGSCQMKADTTCSSYADCNKGEYCQFSPTSCTTDPTLGVCQSVSDCGLYDIDIGDGKKYSASDYGGSCKPDWWTAKDVCASLNMHMPSLSEVGCKVGSRCHSASKANSYWTTDLYEENNPNSCSALFVSTVDRNIYGFARVHANDVLCVR